MTEPVNLGGMGGRVTQRMLVSCVQKGMNHVAAAVGGGRKVIPSLHAHISPLPSSYSACSYPNLKPPSRFPHHKVSCGVRAPLDPGASYLLGLEMRFPIDRSSQGHRVLREQRGQRQHRNGQGGMAGTQRTWRETS